MGLTASTVVDLAKAMLNVRSDNHWSVAQQNLLLNKANRTVFGLLTETDPSWIVSTASFTYPANTESIDLTGASYLNADFRMIHDVYETPNSGSVTDGNPATPWTPAASAHRHRNGGYRSYAAYRLRRTGGETYWSLVDESLYATPIPANTRNLHVEYVPTLATISIAGDEEVLGGKAHQFGDAVVACLTVLMNYKDNNNQMVGQDWQEWQERIVAQGSSRQVQRHRIIGQPG